MGTSWSDSVGELAQEARFDQSSHSWREAADKLVRAADPDTARELAAIGLTEVVSQIHRLERDPRAPCHGDELAAVRHADWAGTEAEPPTTT